MASVVSIQIQIDDGDSAAVVAKIEQAIASLGTTGDGSLKQLSTSADATTASLGQSAEAASAANAGMAQLSTTLAKVVTGYDQVGNAATAAAQRSVRASGEMQQMLDNIERAHQRQGGTGGFTNVQHGPANQLAESFAGIGTAAQEMEQLGMSFAQMPAKIKPAEDAANRFGRGVGGHATTSLDQVRLLSQEFGIRLPRAMENALARFPAIASGLAGFSSGLLALGAAEVFVHMGEELVDLEQKFISIDAPVNEFYDKLKKTSELDFSNTRQLATTNFRQGQAENTAQTAPGMASALQHTGIMDMLSMNVSGMGEGLADLLSAHDVAQSGVTAAGQNIELQRKQLDQTHEATLAQIDLNHAMDATLSRRQQIVAEQQKAADTAKENRAYSTKVEEFYGNRTPGNAGSAEEAQANARAQADASVKTIDLNNQVNAAVMKARDTATQAGLQGEALLREKQKDGVRELIAELQSQHMAEEIPARVAALNAQYDNERLARVRALTEETRKQTAQTELAGLKGVPRADAEMRDKLGNINEAERTKWTGANVAEPAGVKADYQQQRVNARKEADQKITEIETDFNARLKDLSDQRMEAELGGFAKIDAEAKKAKDTINKLYADQFGSYENGEGARNQYFSVVDQAADQQRQQLRAKNAADDLSFDREASQAEARVREQGVMGWVASYRNGIAEIEAQEAQRAAKLSEDLQKGDIEWSDYERRKADIEASANAEIQAQNQQLQQRIAGQLQQAFTNPVEYIKSAMEKMFFEILAGWVMRLDVFKNLFGSTMAGLQPNGTGGAGGPLGATGGVGGVAGMLSHAAGLSGAMRGPAGTAGVISAGTSIAPEYTSTVSGPASFGGYASTASAAAAPASAGGTPAAYGGWGDAAVPSSTVSSGLGSVSSDISAARGMYGQLRGAGLFGGSTGPTLPGAATAQDSTLPTATADNGEGGGFAGYMTGNTDDMSIAAAADDPDAIGSQATQQATAMSSTAGGASALSAGLGIAAAGYGAYQGGKGVYDSFFQTGAKGAMDGTMSGAEAGAAIGSVVPGVGTLIGGAVGAALGLTTNVVGQLTGEAGRVQARAYYRKTLFPEMEGIERNYKSGGGEDWSSAISSANAASATGFATMKLKYGTDAAGWVKSNYLDKETTKVVTDIENAAKGGAMYMNRAAAEFHVGGTVTDFHDFATSATEGFAHLQLGEHITRVQPAAQHAPYLQAINSGANAAQMAAMYLKGAGTTGGGGSTSITHHNNTVNAIDSKSFEQFLDQGGSDAMARSMNRRAGRYSGDAV